MNAKEQATKVMREAEARLQELIADAAKAGNYDTARQLMSWAERVKAIVELKDPSPVRQTSPSKSRKKKRRKANSSGKAGYPKFFRQGNYLVKIGYSKKKKAEYLHKASREAVLRVVEAIAQAGAGGKLFTAEDFMPVEDAPGGLEVPTYQAYVCLAWLRQQGLVQAQGRQGYKLVFSEPIESGIQERWKALPQA